MSDPLLLDVDVDDPGGPDVGVHHDFVVERHQGDGDEKKRSSSLEPIVGSFSRRQPQHGAKWLAQQTVNPYPYRDYIRQLQHFRSRLHLYGKMCQAMAMKGEGFCYSGLWQVVAVLAQMHAEFLDAAPFMQRLAWCLDADIRAAIGDVVKDECYGRNLSPWTVAGKSALDALKMHLAEAARKLDIALDGKHVTVLDALQTLRRATKKLGAEGAPLEDGAKSELEREVQHHLMDPLGKSDFWSDSGFARAFCIGLADLWKQKDHKALTYIIRKAAWLETREPATGPLAWIWLFATLAGPHMGKFKGDSDSIMVLTDRVDTVKTVIPQFQHMCMKLEKVIEQDLGTTGVLRIQICTSGAALMVAACNHLLPVALMHFGFLGEAE